MHTVSVQLNIPIILLPVLKLDTEVERHHDLVGRIPKTDIELSTSTHNGRSVTHKLEAVLEELRLHVRHVLKLFQIDRTLQQLPFAIVWEMGEDQLLRCREEEVLVELVMEFFSGGLFADDPTSSPVSVDEAPCTVDVYCVP